jgi:hypothetical protein
MEESVDNVLEFLETKYFGEASVKNETAITAMSVGNIEKSLE